MKKRSWYRGVGVGVAILLIALIAARTTSSWIGKVFPHRPLARDLLFETLPHVPQLGYVVDLAVVAAVVLLLTYALRGNRRELPTMMALYGLMQFTRAILNVLNPLASPLHGDPYYGISAHLDQVLAPVASRLQNAADQGVSIFRRLVDFSQNGEFPSGHMATVLLCMLLVDKARSPRIRAALGVLVVVEFVALLLSHQHYSIDVVGGLLLSYFVYHEYADGTWFDWLKPFLRV